MIEINENWLKHSGKYECPYCGKQYNKKGIATHIFRKHTEQGLSMKSNFIDYNKNKKHVWNKGLTKETSESIAKQSKTLSKRYKEGRYSNKLLTWRKENPKDYKSATSLGGRNSVAKQDKRSKNEVLFYDMCIEYFNNVKHNEQLFNGWDADIIIEDIKTAVLWNGAWHYKQIMKNQNLKQIQSRDKIKIT
jgi:uncharacterized Zn finger protein (UPF0148 family)